MINYCIISRYMYVCLCLIYVHYETPNRNFVYLHVALNFQDKPAKIINAIKKPFARPPIERQQSMLVERRSDPGRERKLISFCRARLAIVFIGNNTSTSWSLSYVQSKSHASRCVAFFLNNQLDLNTIVQRRSVVNVCFCSSS